LWENFAGKKKRCLLRVRARKIKTSRDGSQMDQFSYNDSDIW
jgi:hypothetical protein